jgi:hypothetical protein
LEINGKRSSSKRTRALNIRYFFLTDQVKKGNLRSNIVPPTIWSVISTQKPLQGEKFRRFQDEILGHYSDKRKPNPYVKQ